MIEQFGSRQIGRMCTRILKGFLRFWGDCRLGVLETKLRLRKIKVQSPRMYCRMGNTSKLSAIKLQIINTIRTLKTLKKSQKHLNLKINQTLNF